MEDHPRGSLNSFPRAAMTKYHKLGGLKQQKCFSLSQFWRLEILNQVLSGACASEGSRGESFLASAAFGGCWRPWLAAAQVQSLLLSSHESLELYPC